MFPRWLVAVVVVCFLVSGMTGLVYEVVWSRYLGFFIGASTYAHTVVLATFMGGLALGNRWIGRRADTSGHLLRTYGILEIGIGLYCALFPTLFPLLGDGYVAIGRVVGPDSALILPLKLILGVIAVLPPTILMGGTLPVLGKYLVKSEAEVGSKIGALYFINTAGAVAGCFLAGFVLIEALGLELSMITAAAVNLVIGVGFLVLDRRLSQGEPEPEEEPAKAAPARFGVWQVRVTLVAIGIGGALSMVYELVWVRLVAIVFGSSTQSFSLMLMSFIAGIALGGAVVAWDLKRRPDRDPLRTFAWCELGIGVSVLAIIPLYERLPTLFAGIQSTLSSSDGAFVLLQISEAAVLLALMAVPTTLIGMTLPLATRVCVSSLSDLGKGVGTVFAVNTVGTLVGASATGLLLIPLLGLQPVLYIGAMGSLSLGMVLLVTAGVSRQRVGQMAAATAVLFSIFTVSAGRWDYSVLTAGFFQPQLEGFGEQGYDAVRERMSAGKILFQADGADTTVVVYESEDGNRYLKVNGKTDASNTAEDMRTQLMLGHLPMLLHPGTPERVFIVGLGSGVTAGAVIQHPGAKADVVELSRAVVHAATYFDEVNAGALSDPRVDLRLGDAKDNLLLDDVKYDVVISEPSNPWIAGIAQLFTVEWFEVVDAHLAEGGILVQWLQSYSLNDESLARTLRTIGAVFPHVSVWRFNASDTMLVASREPVALNREQLAARLARAGVAGQLAPQSLGTVESLLLGQVMSPETVREQFAPRPPLHRDVYPWLEYEAPRSLFRGDNPTLVDALDERMRPASRSRLMLAELVREQPFSKEKLAALRPAAGRAAAPKVLAAIDVALAPGVGEGQEYAIYTGKTDALDLEAIRDLPPNPEPDRCVALYGRVSQRIRRGISVVTSPDPQPLVTLLARCGTQAPEKLLPLRVDLAELLLELGDTAAARNHARALSGVSLPAAAQARIQRILSATQSPRQE